MKKKKVKGTALVTGAAIRIGKEIAIALAYDGYNIALHYNTSAKEAKKTKSEIERLGVFCELFQADLNDRKTYAPLVKKVLAKFPDCNILINNASIFERANFAETDEDIFDRHMTINFKAPFFLSQAFAKKCRAGQIINILDNKITKDIGAFFAYLLSKKSLAAFNRMAARELAPNIRVNGIAIGTTGISKSLKAGDIEKKREILPMKEEVKIEHITRTLIDVINSRHLTGQCIFVDGGENLL